MTTFNRQEDPIAQQQYLEQQQEIRQHNIHLYGEVLGGAYADFINDKYHYGDDDSESRAAFVDILTQMLVSSDPEQIRLALDVNLKATLEKANSIARKSSQTPIF